MTRSRCDVGHTSKLSRGRVGIALGAFSGYIGAILFTVMYLRSR